MTESTARRGRQRYDAMTPEQLRQKIGKLHMTNRQFAGLVGVGQRAVYLWLSGRRGIPHYVATICRLMGV